MYKGSQSTSKNCNRPIRDSGTALLQCKLIYFEVLVGRKLNDVNKIIDVTSYFTKLCHFALQYSSYREGVYYCYLYLPDLKNMMENNNTPNATKNLVYKLGEHKRGFFFYLVVGGK